MNKFLSLGLILISCSLLAPNVSAQSFGGMEVDSPAPVSTNNTKRILKNPIVNQAQKNQTEMDSNPKIMLYYRNFKIDTTPSGRIMCDFELVLQNATPYKINTINMQLVWPSIQTSASFYDVAPRKENYLSMTLMGKGCYSMDKVPNVVVNLCRIKGMSGTQCASSIMWVKVR